MTELFILIISILITLGVMLVLQAIKKKKKTKIQSSILLDKIRRVCKCITVEGDFTEIYHYEDIKQRFLSLISSKKKALIHIKAKAYVGYDLSKIVLKANNDKKLITITQFPQPEILSIETDINYYDKSEGLFNKFDASDLTDLHHTAKQHIQDKIPESDLIPQAKKEALEIILIMEAIVETIGWKLDYTALKIEEKTKKRLN